MGRAVLNWTKGTYTSEEDVREDDRDYHMQGIGSLTGGRSTAELVIHRTVEVVEDKEIIIHS